MPAAGDVDLGAAFLALAAAWAILDLIALEIALLAPDSRGAASFSSTSAETLSMKP